MLVFAVVALLVAPSGTPEADAAVPVAGHHASPISRPPVIVTDAQHAALVIHAGAQPFVVKASAGALPPNLGSSDSALGEWASTAITDVALAGLGAGALLIWRVRILQARKGEEEIG